jgi:hypothetical protein
MPNRKISSKQQLPDRKVSNNLISVVPGRKLSNNGMRRGSQSGGGSLGIDHLDHHDAAINSEVSKLHKKLDNILQVVQEQ